MNYVKNLIKILLIAQCLLFCTCDKKEIITTEQQRLNLADFIKCPFNEEFKNNTNLEKYVIKKFGQPDSVSKSNERLEGTSNAGIIITLKYYNKYSFSIYKGISNKLETFAEIYIKKFIDLKYGINEETTMRDIENLFGQPRLHGQPEEMQNLRLKGSDTYSYTGSYFYYHSHSNDNNLYQYIFEFIFAEGKLKTIRIITHIGDSKYAIYDYSKYRPGYRRYDDPQQIKLYNDEKSRIPEASSTDIKKNEIKVRLKMEAGTYSEDDKYTLSGYDDNGQLIYKRSLIVKEDSLDNNGIKELIFKDIQKDLKYTLEVTTFPEGFFKKEKTKVLIEDVTFDDIYNSK